MKFLIRPPWRTAFSSLARQLCIAFGLFAMIYTVRAGACVLP